MHVLADAHFSSTRTCPWGSRAGRCRPVGMDFGCLALVRYTRGNSYFPEESGSVLSVLCSGRPRGLFARGGIGSLGAVGGAGVSSRCPLLLAFCFVVDGHCSAAAPYVWSSRRVLVSRFIR